MSTPENKSATQQTADSLEQKVKDVMSKSSFDEKTGKVTLSDDLAKSLDEDTLFAVTAEHRRRNTQAGYTKGQQLIKTQAAEIEKLTELLSGNVQVEIPKEDKARLDALKYEDPDAWRKEMDSIEGKAISESRAKLAELTDEVKGAAGQKFELERREQVLKEFNASAETPITDAVIADEVPPRITKKLAEGKVTFEEFLEEVSTYLKTGKVVKNDKTLEQPDLNKVGGGVKPDTSKAEESASSKYKKVTY